MLSADGDKPTGKSGQRNRKTGQRNRKSGQQQTPNPDQLQSGNPDQLQSLTPDQVPDERQQMSAPVASNERASTDAASAEASPASSVASAEIVPVNCQTIANAYGDFTRKSLEQTKSYFEQLAHVRSLDKAFELQTAFVRQACDTFMAESQKIRELHQDLGRQNLKRLEGLLPGMAKPR